MRQLEVELDGGALVRALQSIHNRDVDLFEIRVSEDDLESY